MPVPVDYSLWVDASKWQQNVKYDIWKRNGVEGIIAKATSGSAVIDRSLAEHYAGAINNGLGFAVYHWADPTCNDKAQLRNLLKAIEGYQVEFICVDIEQYWASWEEFYSNHITKFIPAQRISDNGQFLCEEIARTTGKRVLPYTRAWFILEHSPMMPFWYDSWPQKWWAQYTHDRADVILTWENLKSNWLPKSSNPSFPGAYHGNQDWVCWQWTGDKFILPGCKTCLDINYMKRSFAEGKPPAPEIFPKTIVVNASSLNIRTEANGYILGSTVQGKELIAEESEIDESGQKWYKIRAHVASWLTKPKG